MKIREKVSGGICEAFRPGVDMMPRWFWDAWDRKEITIDGDVFHLDEFNGVSVCYPGDWAAKDHRFIFPIPRDEFAYGWEVVEDGSK